MRKTYRPSPKALEHRKAIARDLHRLVAESSGKIVGTVQYFVDGDKISILGLGVHGDCRRQGVARALLAEVARRARRAGISAIVAHTVEETGNVGVFEALGFTVQDRHLDAYSVSTAGGSVTSVSLRMPIELGR